MTILKFNATRTRPITVLGESGTAYYIDPEVSREVEVSESDAQVFLRDVPEIWAVADAQPLEAPAEEAAAPAAGSTRANRARHQAAADDGKS